MKRFYCILLLLFTAAAGYCNCKITTEYDDDDRESIILENDSVRAVILPWTNGRIVEFAAKGKDGLRHCFPELVLETLEITEDICTVSKSNYAGWEDWFWEQGMIVRSIPYQAKTVKNTPEECILSVSCRLPHLELERIMTLKKNSLVLEVEVRLRNTDPQTYNCRFWPHIMVEMDQLSDKSDTFVYSPVKADSGDHPEKIQLQKVPSDRIIAYSVTAVATGVKDMFIPAQPWQGIIRKGLLFGVIFDLDELAPQGMFYNHRVPPEVPFFSAELIMGKRSIPSGKIQRYHTALVAAENIDTVSFLDRNMILSGSVDRKDVIITLTPVRDLGNCTLTLSAMSDSRETVTIPLPRLSAGKQIKQVIRFKSDRSGKTHSFQLKDAAGKTLSSASLLPVDMISK